MTIMSKISSQLDTNDLQYIANQTAMREHLKKLEEKTHFHQAGGADSYKKRHTGQGKLLVRERISLLLDTQSPFLELSHLSG